MTSCKQTDTEALNHKAYIDSVLNHAYTIVAGKYPKKTIPYLDSAYSTLATAGTIDLWKKYDHEVEYYLFYEVDTTKAKLCADSMFAVLKGKEQLYKMQYTATFFREGDVLIAEKKYNDAFKSFYDGRAFAINNLDSNSLSGFTYKLGLVRYIQGQFLKAIPYMKEALAENSHTKADANFGSLFYDTQNYLNGLAVSFERAGMPDSAMRYYLLDLAFIGRNSSRMPAESKKFIESATAVIYGNLGGIYSTLNNYTEAEKYLKESIALNDRPGYDRADAQTAKVKLADMYIRLARFKEADVLLRELQTTITPLIGPRPYNENIRVKWYKLKWAYFDKIHQAPLAYQYALHYYDLRDSLNKAHSGLENADMDNVFKYSEQQYNMVVLKKNNELKTAYLLAIIIFSAMAVCILLVVLYNLRHYKSINKHIRDQNNKMQMATASLIESQKENTRMMNIVAHDLRNPVSATISALSIVIESGHLSADDRDVLEMIKTSNLHSMEMIGDLLSINTYAGEMIKEPTDMQVLLRYCVDLLQFKASEKKQQIILSAQDITASVNKEKIWRVISNLIVNAIKFSPESTVIEVRMDQKQDSLLIQIQDHGIGIPGNIKDKVFDMFTDAKRLGTSGEQTFGLGLAISRQIVEAHNGQIWFESTPGKGTTFFITLPL